MEREFPARERPSARALTAAVLAWAMLGLVACSGHVIHLNPTTLVPAAQGRVQVSRDQNGNIVCQLSVKHLARPASLTPPRNTYVVWIQSDSAAPQSQGELRVTQNLQGQMRFITTLPRFDLFITAENNARVTAPTGPEVLRASVNAQP